MREHELKTWPEFWDATLCKEKTFELRYNDRGFQRGDRLLLRRWDQRHQCYTGPRGALVCEVTYVMSGGRFGLKDDWVCMGIQLIGVPPGAYHEESEVAP